MIRKTIVKRVEQFAGDEDWYVDTYESYYEVGMMDREGAGQLIEFLEDRDIDYQVLENDDVVGTILRIYSSGYNSSDIQLL